MATIGITAGPPGPEPAAQMASEADGGGRTATPAELGQCSPRPADRLRARWEHLRASVWLPLALRALTITLGMLGLAGIGAASILSGLDGRTKVEVPAQADIHAAWVASQGGPEAQAQEHAKDGVEHGAQNLHEKGDTAASTLATADGGAPPGPGITADGKVILNAASADELTRLPGVGQRRAEAIVELRTRLKRFRRVQDLLRVKGIGPRSLKRLMPHMVLDAPAPAADAGGRATASP